MGSKQGKAPGGKPPGAAGGKPPGGLKAETRGCKPRDLEAEQVALMNEFANATPTDPLYFGVEAKTGTKKFEELEKLMTQRVRKSSVEVECKHLQGLLKQMNAAYNVLMAVQAHGLRSQEFADAFDKQLTWINLAPVVEVTFPGHVLLARRRLSLNTTSDNNVWLQLASSTELLKEGIAEGELFAEQDRLLGQRLAVWLKIPLWIVMWVI